MVFGVLLLAIAVLAGVAWLVVRWISFPCHFCNVRVKRFDEVPEKDRDQILAYFQQHEDREPDASALFVCTNCRSVHDDFSGQKASREINAYGCTTFCKVCGRVIYGCLPERESVACRGCGTEYRWETDHASGYRFFMPPEGVKILDGCPPGVDDAGGYDSRPGGIHAMVAGAPDA